MKKLLLLPLFAVLFFACSSDDEKTPDNVFKLKNRVCTVERNSDATISILMCEAQFAPSMPTFDILLPAVPFVPTNGGEQLLAAEIVPCIKMGAAWMPVEKYTISNFSGEISAEALQFRCAMELGKIEFNGAASGNESYTGTTAVTSPGGKEPTDVPAVVVSTFEGVQSTMEESGNAVTVILQNVQFAQGMPAMNIKLADIPAKEPGCYSAQQIIPEISMMGSGWAPNPGFAMNNVQCNVVAEKMYLLFNFSMGNLRYDATGAGGAYTGTITNTKIVE